MRIYLNRFRAGQITGNSVVSKGGEEGIYIASMRPPDVTQSLPRLLRFRHTRLQRRSRQQRGPFWDPRIRRGLNHGR